MGTHGLKAETGGEVPPETATVWDPLVRIFHWSLLAAFVAAYVSGDAWEKLHIKVGYVVIGLIAFRLVWGLIGSTHARFTDFVYRPSTIIAFLRDSVAFKAKRYLGHNPAGGAMVIALLVTLSAIGVSGYMMTMDAFWGAEWVEDLHEAFVSASLILIALHIAGVLFASFEHKENLVKSMFTGRKNKGH
ncbi:MAG: cytochrome b/b6 domain-containing protein [Planktotalea sp.]|uniref:cytochrome b/b6 domain-containing protein n=1 Tax=Planktotalea sp. TaxID=2029877 RepID=UPI003C73088D